MRASVRKLKATSLVELREDIWAPGLAHKIVESVPKGLPLRSFTVPDSGGVLNIATHLYFYAGGHAERDGYRAQREIEEVHASYPLQQKSTLWVEAALVKNFNLHGMRPSDSPGGGVIGVDTIYELRRYQLKLGYDTVIVAPVSLLCV